MHRIFLSILPLLVSSFLYAQEHNYKKINLSFHAGVDYPVGTSNTQGIDPDYRLPFVHKWSGTFDGAYFFTKNYGVGLKYHYFSGDGEDIEFISPNRVQGYGMKETTHFVGPAMYGRWTLGNTRWVIPVNVSLGYVRNTLSDLVEVHGTINFPDPDEFDFGPVEDEINVYGSNNLKSNSIGVMFSAGICFRLLPWLGIGVYGNGMFASADKQHSTDLFFGKSITVDNPRRMNRIGFSAGLDFCF